MKVVLDQDEVLVEFVQGLLDVWNREHGTSFQRADVKSWQLDRTLGEGSYPQVCEILSRPGFFEGLRPKPGACAGVRSLLKAGHRVVIATHVDKMVDAPAYDGKRDWMQHHLPELEARDLFFVSRKSWIDADVLVDDGAHNLEEWAVEAGKPGGILMDAPWNRLLDLSEHEGNWTVYRAFDWDDVLDRIGCLNLFGQQSAGNRKVR